MVCLQQKSTQIQKMFFIYTEFQQQNRTKSTARKLRGRPARHFRDILSSHATSTSRKNASGNRAKLDICLETQRRAKRSFHPPWHCHLAPEFPQTSGSLSDVFHNIQYIICTETFLCSARGLKDTLQQILRSIFPNILFTLYAPGMTLNTMYSILYSKSTLHYTIYNMYNQPTEMKTKI